MIRKCKYPYDNYNTTEPYYNQHSKSYMITLSNENHKFTTSYARYLYSVQHKILLDENVRITHLDQNNTHDKINNLSIQSVGEVVENKFTYRTMARIRCPNCDTIFEIEKRNTHLSKGGIYTSCSKECSNKIKSLLETNKRQNIIDEEFNNKIKSSVLKIFKSERSEEHIIEDWTLFTDEIRKYDEHGLIDVDVSNIPFKDHRDRSVSIKSNNGYRYVYAPTHPRANYKGYIAEHTYLVELDENAYLPKGIEIHHADENKSNNQIENLIPLTSKSHIRLHMALNKIIPNINKDNTHYPTKVCKQCELHLSSQQDSYCSESCYNQYKASKSKKPSKEELLSHLETKSFVSVGKLYGVSDNAVRKWCKSYEIDYKSFSHSRFR